MAKIINVAEISAAVRASSVVHFELTKADLSSVVSTAVTFKIPVKAGTIVHHIGTNVTTAFNTGGSNQVTLAVGDSGSATAFLTTTDTGVQTLNRAMDTYLATTPIKNKYYAADDYILLTLTSPDAFAATPAGCVKGYIVFSNVQYDGILPTADGLAKTSAPYA